MKCPNCKTELIEYPRKDYLCPKCGESYDEFTLQTLWDLKIKEESNSTEYIEDDTYDF